ncbi:MAG: hypothetical protein FWE37_02240 [Spirochaetaceae bacterium]|nr:hypothetical protein [Spirochaetaceae bacterium]
MKKLILIIYVIALNSCGILMYSTHSPQALERQAQIERERQAEIDRQAEQRIIEAERRQSEQQRQAEERRIDEEIRRTEALVIIAEWQRIVREDMPNLIRQIPLSIAELNLISNEIEVIWQAASNQTARARLSREDKENARRQLNTLETRIGVVQQLGNVPIIEIDIAERLERSQGFSGNVDIGNGRHYWFSNEEWEEIEWRKLSEVRNIARHLRDRINQTRWLYI